MRLKSFFSILAGAAFIFFPFCGSGLDIFRLLARRVRDGGKNLCFR